jgi:hypothetical protein
LQEAAASRIGGLVIAIRTYHDQLAALVRAQVADAEVRARVSERQSSEAGVALSRTYIRLSEAAARVEAKRTSPTSPPGAWPLDADRYLFRRHRRALRAGPATPTT